MACHAAHKPSRRAGGHFTPVRFRSGSENDLRNFRRTLQVGGLLRVLLRTARLQKDMTRRTACSFFGAFAIRIEASSTSLFFSLPCSRAPGFPCFACCSYSHVINSPNHRGCGSRPISKDQPACGSPRATDSEQATPDEHELNVSIDLCTPISNFGGCLLVMPESKRTYKMSIPRVRFLRAERSRTSGFNLAQRGASTLRNEGWREAHRKRRVLCSCLEVQRRAVYASAAPWSQHLEKTRRV